MTQDEGHREPLEYTDEEHSILEDDSDGVDDADEFLDEDDSSSLSIPNESIDFDLVYSLHTFVATVEGQANVVKGDSLFLMDDTNSYWWLVRVLKTQEVGYIPAENIETPYERLARLNKHRNVDVSFHCIPSYPIVRLLTCIPPHSWQRQPLKNKSEKISDCSLALMANLRPPANAIRIGAPSYSGTLRPSTTHPQFGTRKKRPTMKEATTTRTKGTSSH